MARRFHRNVWVTSATSFFTDVSSEMILNVLPLFLANVLGVRVWAVGAVEGLAETTAAFARLYSGWLSDRIGKRKWLAVTGYAVSALVKPLYLLATTWTAVAGIRFGDRVGKGIRTAPRDAILAESTTAERRGLVFGLHRAADTLGAVVGLLITIWVVMQLQAGGLLLEAETFRTLVLVSLLPAFLGVLVLAVGATDTRPSGAGAVSVGDTPVADVAGSSARSEPQRPEIRIRGLGRTFGWFVVCSVIFELGNSADAFIVLRAQERGLSVLDVLWVLLGFNLVYTLISAPAGAAADRLGRRGTVVAAWLFYAACYAGFAVASTATHIVTLYLAYGAYHGLIAGAAKALVSDLVPPHLTALAYGGYAAAVGVVSLPASLLGGVLWEGIGTWDGLGPSAPFAFGAGTALLAAGLLTVTVRGGADERAGATG